MKASFRRNQKGLTLIELIIAIGIGLAVIASSYGLLNFGIRSYAENSARVQAQQNIRNVALYVSRDLHRANPGDVTVETMVPAPDGSYSDRLTVDGTTYQVNGSREVLLNGSFMARGISVLDFNLTGNLVEYTITGVYTDRNHTEQSVTVSSSVTLR